MAAPARFLNDNIEIAEANIISSDGSTIDVRYLITDFLSREDIYTHCIAGTLMLIDGIGLIDKLPIVGEEFFTIRFRTPELGNVYVNKSYAIYGIRNRKKVDDKLESYILDLMSLEGMINTMTLVDNNYVGLTYDEISKKIFNNYILESNLKGGIGNNIRYMDIPKIKKKIIDIDKSSGIQALTTIGDNPFTVIQKCADLAQSEDYPDSDFVFYEDRDGFNFVAISSLIEQEPVSDKIGSYVMGDHGVDESRTSKNKKFRFDTVSQFEFNESPDTIKSSSTGMYGNKIQAFDPILKKRTSIVNNYHEIQSNPKIPSFKTLDKNNILSDRSLHKNDNGTSHTQYYISNIFDKNYEEVEYMKNRIAQNTDRHLFHHDNSYKSRGRTAMKLSLLNNYTLTIAVGGNSNLKAGVVINLVIPLSSDLEEDKIEPHSHLFGNKKSNKFLVTAVTHNFLGTAGRYFTYLTLAKDSYFNDINKSYKGKMLNDTSFGSGLEGLT